MKKLIFSILIISILIVAGYIGTLVYAPINIPETVFVVKNGASAYTIANDLIEQRIIKNRLLFIGLIRMSKLSSSLKSGSYIFGGELNLMDVIHKIENGNVRLKKLKIIEGLTLTESLQEIAKSGFGNFEVLNELAYNSEFIESITGMNITSLEGFLYPDTYFLSDGLSEEFILKYLTNIYFSKTSKLDYSSTKLSKYEVLILASIVEKEVRIREEGALVANVYLNRIKIGLKLQADPTVVYILRKRNIFREKVYYKDLEIDSPYNTYFYEGLPPTPICNPSITSIEAVLNPAKTENLFFFADGTGGHTFTKTYSSHLRGQKLLKAKNSASK